MDIFVYVPIPGYEAETRYIGLGDLVQKVLSAVGIHAWEGCQCEQRRVWLNRYHLPAIVYIPILPELVEVEIPLDEAGANHHSEVV